MAGSAGGVDNVEVKNGLFGVFAVCCLVYCGIKGPGEDIFDELGGGVVAASGFSLMAFFGVECEGGGGELGVEFEE